MSGSLGRTVIRTDRVAGPGPNGANLWGSREAIIAAAEGQFRERGVDAVGLVEPIGLDEGGRRARAIALFSEMAGALLLSRAVADADPALADEILESARVDLRGRTSTE
ncbi:hypothetical protein [Streptomyces sp. NPDC058614]|uniref:hypothetical protein n=1 Tax=Streptomyces sp. NPDC058614 TaxID=3346557 RepID=UPI0036581D87